MLTPPPRGSLLGFFTARPPTAISLSLPAIHAARPFLVFLRSARRTNWKRWLRIAVSRLYRARSKSRLTWWTGPTTRPSGTRSSTAQSTSKRTRMSATESWQSKPGRFRVLSSPANEKKRRNLYIFAWAHTHAPIGKKTNRPCPSVRPGSGVLTSCVGVCPSLSMSASAVHIKTSTSNTRATRPQPVVCVCPSLLLTTLTLHSQHYKTCRFS